MEKCLSVSEMAQMHNISRQTLIYYDKIGLFKPDHIDEHGYRYYSPYQIPYLREICILKSAGVKLEDIKNNISHRNINTVASLLTYQKQVIDNEIVDLLKKREFIEQRLEKYTNINLNVKDLCKPKIESYPNRKMVFLPYEHEISREELHLNMIKAWNILIKNGIFFYGGFGTLIKEENLKKENIFEGSGICFFLPNVNYNMQNIINVPSGEYACMYKYGMPYEAEFIHTLISWIENNGYEVIGDVIDECLLDTTFYENDNTVDFCQLQIPVRKIR